MPTLAQQIDQMAKKQIDQIMKSPDSSDVKYELLDRLFLMVTYNHPSGWAAKVLKEISDAQDAVMYPKGGDSE